MTPVSENGPGPTVLSKHERGTPPGDSGFPLKLFVLSIIVMVFLVSIGMIGAHVGYKRGLAACPAPEEVIVPTPVESPSPQPEPSGLAELRECRSLFEDYRKVEAANRANERLLGWNDGYGVGRKDWTALPYDCLKVGQ
jgi:hypothetical protein